MHMFVLQKRLLPLSKGLLLLSIVTLAGCSNLQGPSEEELRIVQTRVEVDTVPAFVADDDRSRKNWEWTRQVYTQRQFHSAWSVRGQVLPEADAALKVLENATLEGLRPDDFDVQELRSSFTASSQGDSAALADFDVHLTNAVVRYVSQLCFGRIGPHDVNEDWSDGKSNCDVPQIVRETIEQGTIENLGQSLSPPLLEFQGLRAALQHYRQIAAQGGWEPLPLDAVKKKGAPPLDLTLVAERLTRTGDLTVAAGESPSDEPIYAAVERFRVRHGLEGKQGVDEKVIAALNIPIEQRIEQIEINMDRMRWMAAAFEPNHIRVNIPAFHLSVHENDQASLLMRVIVGSKEDPTPLLDGKIEYLVFSPYWNVPLSIAKDELVPKIKANSNYLRQQQLEVVKNSGGKIQSVDPSKIDWDEVSDGQFQLRQKPGTQNSLGLVKFIFPNPYNVYLHDTPSDNLFDRLTRTLSHGCIRLERPVDLAAYLLRDQPEWTAEQIEAAMHAGKEKRVPLSAPMPVHLIYWTAWADGEGMVHFREDVYGHDVVHRARIQPALVSNGGI